MNHEIIFDAEIDVPDGVAEQMERVIAAALEAEGVAIPCEINVLLTDDEGIRELNKEYRGIDSATDVLSFPLLDFEEEIKLTPKEKSRLTKGGI